VPTRGSVAATSPKESNELERIMLKQIQEAEVMQGFIESPGWLLLKEFMIDRIRNAKNKVFEKAFPVVELEATKREVYILKKILERPDRMIEMGAEATKSLGSKSSK